MPADREYQRRRQLVIRNILREDPEPVKDQKDLIQRLRKKGIPATQPSVSRDLRELGAVRANGRYSLPSWTETADTSPFRRVLGLIRSIRTAGPYQILIQTQDGAGATVAAAIEQSDWEDVVGTVEGYSSVLLLTEHKLFQDLVLDQLKYFREKFM